MTQCDVLIDSLIANNLINTYRLLQGVEFLKVQYLSDGLSMKVKGLGINWLTPTLQLALMTEGKISAA